MKSLMRGFVLVASVAISGCNIFAPAPNPAAVLEGTWQAEFAVPGDLEGYDVRLTFDSSGQLTEITATAPAGAVATFDGTGATTEVSGDQVTVTVPALVGTSVFEGTLSADENTIDGSLSQNIEFQNGSVTLPSGDLTLTRVAE